MKRRLLSLQWRLALGVSSLFMILMLLAGTTVTVLLRYEMDEVLDLSMRESAQRILPLAVTELTGRDRHHGNDHSIARLNEQEESLTYIVTDRNQQVLLKTHDADISVFPPYQHDGYVTTEKYRIYYDSAIRGDYHIAIAEPLTYRDELTWEMFLALILPLVIGVPLSLVLVWWVVRWSLRSVRYLQQQVGERTSYDMRPLNHQGLPAEIAPLAEAINHLLVRVKQSLEAERSFSRHAAHEMRTPLAAALAQTQRLLASVSDNKDTASRARLVEQSLLRLNRLSEKLLHLARAESAQFGSSEPFDVLPIFKLVLSEFSHRPEQLERLQVHYPRQPVYSSMDPDAWAILLRNLVENALKHGDRNEAVDIILHDHGGIVVSNAGPILAADMLERLTRPFERGNSEADGSGLGLAIAKTLAQSGGGRLVLMSPASSREDGFEARFEPGS